MNSRSGPSLSAALGRFRSGISEYLLNFPSFTSVVARNNDILKKLVLEAKRMYEKDAEHRVHIFIADA